LRIRDPHSLRAALGAFRRRARPFGPRHLAALSNASSEERLDPAYRSALVAFTASSVLGERAAADYARAAATNGPRALRGGFARQADDERRHAQLDEIRLRQLGIDPAKAPTLAPNVASDIRAAARTSDPLQQMFETNFVGESALAGATFPFVIRLARANVDRRSVELNRARLADEVSHVRFASLTFEILVGQDPRNVRVLEAWQEEHFSGATLGFLADVAPALDRAPNRPPGDWLGDAMRAYGRRANALGLRLPGRL
jgi:hypothetical protein